MLLISRYREELHGHADRHAAMAVALRRAGPAILASATTVIAGLLCLFAADLNSTRSLGGVGAIGRGRSGHSCPATRPRCAERAPAGPRSARPLPAVHGWCGPAPRWRW
ncbi:MAG: MMPL family transporter [Pseudonocardiaceae bacterium]